MVNWNCISIRWTRHCLLNTSYLHHPQSRQFNFCYGTSLVTLSPIVAEFWFCISWSTTKPANIACLCSFTRLKYNAIKIPFEKIVARNSVSRNKPFKLKKAIISNMALIRLQESCYYIPSPLCFFLPKWKQVSSCVWKKDVTFTIYLCNRFQMSTQAKYTFLVFAIKALIWLKGGLVVIAGAWLRIERPGLEPWPGTLSCVLCHVFTKSKL